MSTYVSRIARRQARLSGFVESPSPPPKASEASEGNDDFDDDDDDEDGDASSSGTDEMSTRHSYPLSLVTKKGVVLVMRVVIIRGRVSIGDFC